jgi:hypothetical protein
MDLVFVEQRVWKDRKLTDRVVVLFGSQVTSDNDSQLFLIEILIKFVNNMHFLMSIQTSNELPRKQSMKLLVKNARLICARSYKTDSSQRTWPLARLDLTSQQRPSRSIFQTRSFLQLLAQHIPVDWLSSTSHDEIQDVDHLDNSLLQISRYPLEFRVLCFLVQSLLSLCLLGKSDTAPIGLQALLRVVSFLPKKCSS